MHVLRLLTFLSAFCAVGGASGRAEAAPAAPGAAPPSGLLLKVEAELHPPDALLAPAIEGVCRASSVQWIFHGHDHAAMERLFDAARIAPALRTELWRGLTGCSAEQGCAFQVPLALLGRLDLASRAVLYRALGRDPESAVYAKVFRRRPAEMERWIASLDLPPKLRAEVRALVYPDGPYLSFVDSELLCARLTSPAERRAFLRGLNETRGQLVHLRVPHGAPVDALARYWGAGGREREVLRLLGAAAGRQGGATVDIVELLPAFARARLHRYPAPQEQPRSCYWAAFNFFAQEPDDRYLVPALLPKLVNEGYATVPASERRLGDVLLFGTDGGLPLHAAVYVADDLVFTKNGRSALRPYTLMRIADLEELYPGARTVYLRRR